MVLNGSFNPSKDQIKSLTIHSYGCGEHFTLRKPGLPLLLSSKVLYVLSCVMDSETDNVQQFMQTVEQEDASLTYVRYQPSLPEDISMDAVSELKVVKAAASEYAEKLLKSK